MTLASPEHQEMNRQVEVTWRKFRTIVHSLMVHDRVSEAYIRFSFMYTIYHIFPVIPIKDLMNEDGYPTTSHKLAIGTKFSVSYLRFLFCPCDVQKAIAHVETKVLNMRHQAQKVFSDTFVVILQHKKGYLVYVSSKRKIISSYDVVIDESFSSVLAYTSQPYSEALSMRPSLAYTPCATSSREQTGDVITFTQFEERNITTKTRNDAESGDKSDDESIITLYSGDELDHDLIST